jgi:hypothetical protein
MRSRTSCYQSLREIAFNLVLRAPPFCDSDPSSSGSLASSSGSSPAESWDLSSSSSDSVSESLLGPFFGFATGLYLCSPVKQVNLALIKWAYSSGHRVPFWWQVVMRSFSFNSLTRWLLKRFLLWDAVQAWALVECVSIETGFVTQLSESLIRCFVRDKFQLCCYHQ